MAKGLRASVKKSNRSKLRSRVFAPVEDARTERLSAKLLELASQSRPAKSEMEVEENSTKAGAEPQAQAQAQAQAEGSLLCSSCRIPQSLSPNEEGASQPQKAQKAKNAKNTDEHKFPEEEMFYHLLGVSSDILGFSKSGNLLLSLGKMEVDDAPSAAKAASSSSSKPKKKADRIQKKRRGKATSSITFPAYRKGAKGGATGKRSKS